MWVSPKSEIEKKNEKGKREIEVPDWTKRWWKRSGLERGDWRGRRKPRKKKDWVHPLA